MSEVSCTQSHKLLANSLGRDVSKDSENETIQPLLATVDADPCLHACHPYNSPSLVLILLCPLILEQLHPMTSRSATHNSPEKNIIDIITIASYSSSTALTQLYYIRSCKRLEVNRFNQIMRCPFSLGGFIYNYGMSLISISNRFGTGTDVRPTK